MLNGSFGKFEDVEDIRKKINNHTYEHNLEGNTVKAVIQLSNTRSTINNLPIIQGNVIDFRMKSVDSVEQDENGKYIVHKEIAPRPVVADFQIIGTNLVRTFVSFDRDIVMDILSHALYGKLDLVKPVNFDLQRMYNDYENHWIGSIFDREGNMQKGTFYGTKIEKDDVIGKCWKTNKKSVFGFETEYFGNQPVKVRVSLDGGVQVHANITDQQYLQFVLNELGTYVINPPRRTRHKRTS